MRQIWPVQLEVGGVEKDEEETEERGERRAK